MITLEMFFSFGIANWRFLDECEMLPSIQTCGRQEKAILICVVPSQF
jgi:hypothetical protein